MCTELLAAVAVLPQIGAGLISALFDGTAWWTNLSSKLKEQIWIGLCLLVGGGIGLLLWVQKCDNFPGWLPFVVAVGSIIWNFFFNKLMHKGR